MADGRLSQAGQGMKKRIHVNQHVIRRNYKTGEREPPISIKTSDGSQYAHKVIVSCPCEVVYSPDKPLSCGARVWIETHSAVLADGVEVP